MPAAAVRSKVDACPLRARVVLHGAHVGEAFAEMERLRDEEDLRPSIRLTTPRCCRPWVIGLELLEDLPDVDVVVVGVGGGGLISGIAAAVKEQRPEARIYGVEPGRSNALSLAIERNEIVPIQPERGRRPRRPVCRRLDAGDGPALPRRRDPARRSDHLGMRFAISGSSRSWSRPAQPPWRPSSRVACRSTTGGGSSSCCRAATSRSIGSAAWPGRDRCRARPIHPDSVDAQFLEAESSIPR
jgi:hypothetical protein